jgi:hypothetical protein
MLVARSVTTSFPRLAAALAVMAGFATSANADEVGLISSRQPDGMIISTDNIYFTTHDQCGGHIWRTAQASSPGQEREIYADHSSQFSDIVFANVGGTFYGYFLAATGPFFHTCQSTVVTQAAQHSVSQRSVGPNGSLFQTYSIKRIQLDGLNGVDTLKVLHNVNIESGHRNLVADDSFLYWQDTTSVRKMSLDGGPDTALDTIASDAPTAGLGLDDKNVYYASGSVIYRVPKAGTSQSLTERIAGAARARVMTLQVMNGSVYWGEQDGTVRANFLGDTEQLAPADQLVPTSIWGAGRDPYGVVTTKCDTLFYPHSCELQYGELDDGISCAPIGQGPFSVTAKPLGAPVYWGDAAGIHATTIGMFGRSASCLPEGIPAKHP